MKPILLVLGLAAIANAAWAQKASVNDLWAKDPAMMDSQLPPSPFAGKPLPEVKGVVSWKTLAQVEPIRQKDRFVPQFSNAVTALDRKDVKIQGFIMPLDMGEKQKRFILSALPPTCSYCLPGGPEQLVEVQAKSPIKYGFEPVVISGKMEVLRDDPMGLYYRVTNAVALAQ